MQVHQWPISINYDRTKLFLSKFWGSSYASSWKNQASFNWGKQKVSNLNWWKALYKTVPKHMNYKNRDLSQKWGAGNSVSLDVSFPMNYCTLVKKSQEIFLWALAVVIHAMATISTNTDSFLGQKLCLNWGWTSKTPDGQFLLLILVYCSIWTKWFWKHVGDQEWIKPKKL